MNHRFRHHRQDRFQLILRLVLATANLCTLAKKFQFRSKMDQVSSAHLSQEQQLLALFKTLAVDADGALRQEQILGLLKGTDKEKRAEFKRLVGDGVIFLVEGVRQHGIPHKYFKTKEEADTYKKKVVDEAKQKPSLKQQNFLDLFKTSADADGALTLKQSIDHLGGRWEDGKNVIEQLITQKKLFLVEKYPGVLYHNKYFHLEEKADAYTAQLSMDKQVSTQEQIVRLILGGLWVNEEDEETEIGLTESAIFKYITVPPKGEGMREALQAVVSNGDLFMVKQLKLKHQFASFTIPAMYFTTQHAAKAFEERPISKACSTPLAVNQHRNLTCFKRICCLLRGEIHGWNRKGCELVL